MERKKILVISDHPLVPSGVGIQTKYLIEGLLETERYKFVCLGGAIKHANYNVQEVASDKFGKENWIIHPVNGHGDKALLRAFLKQEKPDGVLLVTDPRFFVWVWEMEDEIRAQCPLFYWHVWDNDPSPEYNLPFYESTDGIGCISLKTFGILQDLNYQRMKYIPHALPDQLFKPLPSEDVEKFKQQHYGPHANKKFIVMWNNRNARRKQTGDVIGAFAKFAKRVGVENVALFMHTAPDDPEGQNITAVAEKYGVDNNLIISQDRVPPEALNSFYNVADVVINIASNEGFGLGTLEAMFSGTPIIVHMTGGLQYQMGDWYDGFKDFSNQDKLTAAAKKKWEGRQGIWTGIPVFSSSRSCTGSQQIPYIYDDRVCHDDVVNALMKMYGMGSKKRKKLGLVAREWATKTFTLENMVGKWDELLVETMENFKPTSVRTTTL